MHARDLWPRIFTRGSRRSRLDRRVGELRREVHDTRILAAQLLIRQTSSQGVLPRLRDAEFKVFSQFGDDGIIQYLIHLLQPTPEVFVEFGVEDYSEANTRFLLVNNNWRGMVMDGGAANMQALRQDALYWRHDLTAAAAFVDRDNINALLREHGFVGEIGLLSIDIDGNDYWVWERIDCLQPTIVIAEYNSVFGADRAVSIPYEAAFTRTAAHYSNLYWGCSLPALCHLARRKGYAFVGCNSNGNNAYFVRRENVGPLRELTAREGFVESRFRESRGPDGSLTFLSGEHRREAIAHLPVVDVESGQTITVRDCAVAR